MPLALVNSRIIIGFCELASLPIKTLAAFFASYSGRPVVGYNTAAAIRL